MKWWQIGLPVLVSLGVALGVALALVGPFGGDDGAARGDSLAREESGAVASQPAPSDGLAAPTDLGSAVTDRKARLPDRSPGTGAAAGGGAQTGGEVGDRAPEFSGIANWINSTPLTMEVLRGKVVLIDFWTYTCVNCIRTFPALKEWHAKYADRGLVIVGVHSPEFDFEKITDNVVKSAQEFALEYPIAQDNDFDTWRSYDNRFWPAKYLVDQQGVVRFTHFGEGAYGDTEEQIRQLLEEGGADLAAVPASKAPDPAFDPRARASDPAKRITREIYGGFLRNATPGGIYVAHLEYYNAPNRPVFYTDPGDHLNQFMYLQGPWLSGFEQLRHARPTQGYEDYIALKFFATSVNAVIDPEGGEPFDVLVTLDGRPLRPEEAGADLVVAEGRSFFRVAEGRMYRVVALPQFGGHELQLSANSEDFSLFAFTFGAYTQGP